MRTISIGLTPIMGVMLGIEYHSEDYEEYSDHYVIIDLLVLCVVISVERE